MNRLGTVVRITPGRASVAIAGNTHGPSVAPCCQVPDVILDASNPGFEIRQGDTVEIADGLGALIGGCGLFVVLPVLLGYLAFFWIAAWWAGLTGAILGLAAAAAVFRLLRVGRFPRIVSHSGTA